MIPTREYAEDDWHSVCRVHGRALPDELHGSCDPRAFVPLAGDALALYRSEGFAVARTSKGENAGKPCTCPLLEPNQRENCTLPSK